MKRDDIGTQFTHLPMILLCCVSSVNHLTRNSWKASLLLGHDGPARNCTPVCSYSLTEFTYYMLYLTKPARKGNYLSPAAGPGVAILWVGSGPRTKHRPPCCGVPSVAWFPTTAVGLFALFCFDIISIFQKNYMISASNSNKLGSICLHFYLLFCFICFIILSPI